MKTISETEALHQLIAATEEQASYELALLREQFQVANESLKPVNLIKNTIRDITASSESKSDIISNLLGLGTGMLSKKMLVGNSESPFKKALGTAVEFTVAGFVSKYAEDITAFGSNLWKKIWSKDNP